MWCALFPGQGSQAPGMGRFLFDEFSQVRLAFEEASDGAGVNIKSLCFDGSEADLALTENTQPCLLTVSTAAARVLRDEFGFDPRALAGHSVGEYAAVVAAGALSLGDAARAVRIRGQAMQSAVPVGQGGMTAVLNLEPAQVSEVCAWASAQGAGVIEPANLNAPGQIVISGAKAALDWLGANYSSERFPDFPRAKLIPLKVSAPFHCAMMAPAAQRMAEVLADLKFSDARVPVVQNTTAEAVTDANTLRENLVAQVCAPVRWIECVQTLVRTGHDRAVEVGVGKVLSGLVKKIDSKSLRTLNVNSLEDLRAVEKELKGAS